MGYRVVATGFQHLQEAVQIALEVGLGAFQGIAHPRLGRQVADMGNPLLVQQTTKGLPLLNPLLHKGQSGP